VPSIIAMPVLGHQPACARIRAPVARIVAAIASILLTTVPASAAAPLNYLTGHGPRNVATLTWAVLIISIVVTVVIVAILIAAMWRGAATSGRQDSKGSLIVERSRGSITAIYAGLALSTLILLGVTVWTMVTLADVSAPPSKPKITIEIIGHQWWWEVKYLNSEPSQIFSTANEIHIPVGEPVTIKLRTDDVIHSFWVPALSGKTDLIPGQTNTTWLLADKAGTYRGQCTEYCGLQHAHMGLEVIASPPDKFEAWRENQLRAASTAALSDGAGQRVFLQKCAVCHTIRGTRAGGNVGPDLTHLMSRQTIAAATLPNRIAHLSAWIADAQRIKPGNKMPTLNLEGKDLARVRDFLQKLE
jgi:cytochrome c oxidase subunit 2